jgi:hypothetical protein
MAALSAEFLLSDLIRHPDVLSLLIHEIVRHRGNLWSSLVDIRLSYIRASRVISIGKWLFVWGVITLNATERFELNMSSQALPCSCAFRIVESSPSNRLCILSCIPSYVARD